MFDIEKKLSEIALEDVLSIKDEDIAGKYKSLAKGFGSRIMNNTLLGAMAFLASKGGNDLNDEHTVLFMHISDAIKKVYSSVPWKLAKEYRTKDKRGNPILNTELYEEVLKHLSRSDAITDVMYIQELAMQYVTYLRRYVAAFIEKEEEAG